MRATYGEPSHTLDPQSRDLTIGLNLKGERIDSALQYVPADVSIALSAIFVISADRVVAIEVSADI